MVAFPQYCIKDHFIVMMFASEKVTCVPRVQKKLTEAFFQKAKSRDSVLGCFLGHSLSGPPTGPKKWGGGGQTLMRS